MNLERRVGKLEEDLAPPEDPREALAAARRAEYERLCPETVIPPEEEKLLLELAARELADKKGPPDPQEEARVWRSLESYFRGDLPWA
jgi:DNA-directed RNA polymerase subunit K/omega